MRYLIIGIFLWLISTVAFITFAPDVPDVSNNSQNQSEASENAVTLPPLTSRIPINQGVYYLLEKKPIKIEEIGNVPASQWTLYPGKVANFQTRDYPVWLRFDVYNSLENGPEWLLKVMWPHLDQIEVLVYHREEQKWDAPMISGLAVPMALRPKVHRNFLFPVSIIPGERTTIYVRSISQTKLIFPLILWQKEIFAEKDSHHLMLLGIIFGIISVMLLYNLSLFIFTRDKVFLVYSIYIFSIILYTLMGTGIGPQFVWDDFSWLKTHGYGVLSAFCFIAAVLFVRVFLTLKNYGGWIYHLNNIFLALWVVFLAIYIIKPAPFLIKSEDLLALASIAAGMVTGIYIWRKGNISARYFTMGWAFVMLGTFLLLMAVMGVMELNLFTMYSQTAGFIVELVLLSFALADRINRERRARFQAQKLALDLTQKVSRELEQRVHERTVDLKKAMLRLRKANKVLAELTITDPLTRVYNRRYFDKVIANEVKRANRASLPLAVVMVDIDHFKSINDVHGHPVGDKCLYLVARTLCQQMARSSDMVARYGGEEFVLVLTATPKDKAIFFAEKVRQAIEQLVVINKGVRLRLRASFGVAAWIPGQDEPQELLIQAADEALYQAKRNGRNQVAVCNASYDYKYLN